MGRNLIVKIFRAILWRLVHRTREVVLRASYKDSDLVSPEGATLIRIAGITPKAGHELLEDAMLAAGEPNSRAASRLSHGDEFFGWLVGGKVVSFGWVTYRDRTVGPIRLVPAQARAFLFDFYTLEGYRGRGLYTALLLAIRCVLGREKVTECIINVNVRNTASVSGIEKAGFLPVAEIAYLTIFNRWGCSLFRSD